MRIRIWNTAHVHIISRLDYMLPTKRTLFPSIFFALYHACPRSCLYGKKSAVLDSITGQCRANLWPAVPDWPWCQNANERLKKLTATVHYLQFAVWTYGVYFFINAGMSDCPASNQSGTGMKKTPVRYRDAPVPYWDTGCRNADAGGIGLDSDAQLCLTLWSHDLLIGLTAKTPPKWQKTAEILS